MAKPKYQKVMLESEAGTGYRYYVRINPTSQTEKMRLRKYDPIARKHVHFSQKKLPNPKKN